MVSDNYSPDQYAWNGIVGYEINFDFDKTSDVLVVHIADDGTETTRSLNTDYTIALDNGEWIMTPLADWLNGSIMMSRATPKEQTWNVRLAATINRGVLEDTLDRIVLMIQEAWNVATGKLSFLWVGTQLQVTDSEGNVELSPDLKGEPGEGIVRSGYLTEEEAPDIAFDNGTRTFTASVPGGRVDFRMWCNNVEIVKTAPETIVVPDVTGTYFIYFDNAGTIQILEESALSLEVFYEYAITALVYWNSESQTSILGDERHGAEMDARTHHYNHSTFGARYERGMDLEGLTNNGETFTQLTSGFFWDEDIRHTIAAQAAAPFLYRLGANGAWRETTPDNQVSYNNGGSFDVWNQNNGGVWELTEGAGDSDFWIIFYVVTNDAGAYPIKKIIGQNAYRNVSSARNAIADELSQLNTDGLPSPEYVYLFATIVHRSGEIRELSDGGVYLDLRSEKGGVSGTSSSSGVAQDILVDTTNFSNNLSGTDVNVQAALDTIDDMVAGSGGVNIYQGNKVPIGQIDRFATNADKTGEGYFGPFQDGSELQASHPYLFAEIGHKYNALHVLAGHADLSGSGTHFYPTPPPSDNGWLKIWEDTPATVVTVPNITPGVYKVHVDSTGTPWSNNSGEVFAELEIKDVNSMTVQSIFVGAGSSTSAIDVSYNGSNNKAFTTAFGGNWTGGQIVKIEKQEPETMSTDGAYGFIKSFDTYAPATVITADNDYQIGASVPYMGNLPVPTGLVVLTNTNQTVNIADYPKLFDVYGTKYGGDGITTFKLPTIAQAGFDNYYNRLYTFTNVSDTLTQQLPEAGSYRVGLYYTNGGDNTMEFHISWDGINQGYSATYNDTLNGTNTGRGHLYPYITEVGLLTSLQDNVSYTQSSIAYIDKLDVPENVTPCIYVGNGGQYAAQDSGLEARVVKLENLPIFAETPYETEWTVNSDWTAFNKTITHDKGVPITKLLVQVFLSETGSDLDAIPIYDSSDAPAGDAFGLKGIDNNSFQIKTGDIGIAIINSSSNVVQRLDTETYYYKVIVNRLAAVPLINAYNAFINQKDWVSKWADTPAAVVDFIPQKGTLYKIRVNATANSVVREQVYYLETGPDWVDTTPLEAPNLSEANNAANKVVVFYDGGNKQVKTTVAGAYTQALITDISAHEDTTGASKPSTPIDEGWEDIYNEPNNATNTVTKKVEDGIYRLHFNNSVSNMAVDFEIDSSRGTTDARSSWFADQVASYTYSTGVWATGAGGYNIKKIEKFTGRYALDLNVTRARISGTPNHKIFQITPTPGQDYDFTSDLPAHATLVHGDKMEVFNAAPKGSTDKIINLPLGHKLPAQKSIIYTYAYQEQLWTIDNSALQNYTIDKKDWVEKWNDIATDRVATSDVKDFEIGRWLVKASIVYGGTTRHISAELDITDTSVITYMADLGATPTVTDYAYLFYDPDLDGGSFRFSRNGSWNTPIIKSIEKWQDTTGSDKPSVPLDAGWEQIYKNWANNVEDLPDSAFEFGLNDRLLFILASGSTEGSANYQSELMIRSLTSDSYGSISGEGTGLGSSMNVKYEPSSNTFRVLWYANGWYIKEVYRQTGKMSFDIYHTNAHVSGTPNDYEEFVNTNSGNVDFTPLYPSAPNTGDRLTVVNTGTGAFYVENLPGDYKLLKGQTAVWVWNETEAEYFLLHTTQAVSAQILGAVGNTPQAIPEATSTFVKSANLANSVPTGYPGMISKANTDLELIAPMDGKYRIGFGADSDTISIGSGEGSMTIEIRYVKNGSTDIAQFNPYTSYIQAGASLEINYDCDRIVELSKGDVVKIETYWNVTGTAQEGARDLQTVGTLSFHVDFEKVD